MMCLPTRKDDLMSIKSSNLYALAKHEALTELISNHAVEYDAMLKKAKLKYGITPRLSKVERIAMLEQTIVNLRKEK